MKFRIGNEEQDVMKLLQETEVTLSMNAYEALLLSAVFIDNSSNNAHKNLKSLLNEYNVNEDAINSIMQVLSVRGSLLRSNFSVLESKIINEVMGGSFKNADA